MVRVAWEWMRPGTRGTCFTRGTITLWVCCHAPPAKWEVDPDPNTHKKSLFVGDTTPSHTQKKCARRHEHGMDVVEGRGRVGRVGPGYLGALFAGRRSSRHRARSAQVKKGSVFSLSRGVSLPRHAPTYCYSYSLSRDIHSPHWFFSLKTRTRTRKKRQGCFCAARSWPPQSRPR